MTVRLLLDEHVGRVFERVLRERGYTVVQAKDEFGEDTDDVALFHWCRDEGTILVTNNARDFRPLHAEYDHAGLFLFRDQGLPDEDSEGLARAIAEVLGQYGEDVENELVDLDEWYDWLHGEGRYVGPTFSRRRRRSAGAGSRPSTSPIRRRSGPRAGGPRRRRRRLPARPR